MRVTAEMLKRGEPCRAALRKFRALWPQGASLTPDNVALATQDFRRFRLPLSWFASFMPEILDEPGPDVRLDLDAVRSELEGVAGWWALPQPDRDGAPSGEALIAILSALGLLEEGAPC